MSVYIVGAGCTFPSGPNLALADIAHRTGLAMIRRRPLFVDRCGIPIKASYFTSVPFEDETLRWQMMCKEALQDLLSTIPANIQHFPLRLWLVLPPPERPGIPASLAEVVSKVATSILLNCQQVTLIHGSHASGINVLDQVMQIQAKDIQTMLDIVLAVDSWMAHDTLLWLDKQQLIYGSYVPFRGKNKVNAYGRVPGEGAAAIALSRHPLKYRTSEIKGVGVGNERYLRGDEQPCTGQGLSDAANLAWQMADKPIVSSLFTDMNGEPYRADEYGFTLQRCTGVLSADYQRHTPVLCSGDLGCASLITHTALAWRQQCERVNTEAQHTLIIASSDDSTRGAIILKSDKGN